MNAAQRTEQTWLLRERGDGEVIQKPTTSKKIHLLGFRGSDSCLLVIPYNYQETFTATSCLDLFPDAMIKHWEVPTWMGEGLSGFCFNCLSLSAAGEEFKQKPRRNTFGGACFPRWAQFVFFLHPRTICLGWHYPMGAGPPTSVLSQENAHRHGQKPPWWMQFLS